MIRTGVRHAFFVVLVALAVAAGVFVWLEPERSTADPIPGSAPPSIPDAPRSPEEQRIIDVYRTRNEAVVFITTITLTLDPFEVFPEIRPQEGTGSGVIVDARRGIVLTNLHVIREAHRMEVLLANGQTYRAQFIGFDDEYDIAVIKLENPPPNLSALPFGDSSRVLVGQRVLAIGNPFGLNRTLTTGIVSSADRTLKSRSGTVMKGLIQTDAAINPGNSGGPLLDMAGNMIGLNTAILSQSGDSAGIGFAVPINSIKRVLPELIATGKVLRPKIGWMLVDTTQGPMVRRVVAGSPAEEAGIEPIERKVESVFVRGFTRDVARADLIYKVNGVRVKNVDDVEDLVSKADYRRGIVFTMRRGGLDGRERQVTVKPVLR